MWPFDRVHKRVKRLQNRPFRGNERVAIMLLSVTPQLAATIYRHLSPDQIREINHQMSGMVYLEDRDRIEIISKHMGIDLTPELESRQDLLSVVIAALEAYIRTDAEKAARSFELLLENWPRTGPSLDIKSVVNSRPFQWNDPAEAAVLFMSLPPELSAQLFQELDSESVRSITLEIVRLPNVSVQKRTEIIRKFLDINEGRSHLDKLQLTLESVVGANPKKSAGRLLETWPGLVDSPRTYDL